MQNYPSIVTVHTAHKMIGNSNPFMLVLNKGENVAEAIIAMATKAELKSASFFGIGALKDPKLSFFNVAEKKYQDKIFPGVFELIILTGNITKMQNQYIAHVHAAISNNEFNIHAGHLSHATVGVTAEITIIPFNFSIERALNTEFKLNLMKE